jgi:hypothetical protein
MSILSEIFDTRRTVLAFLGGSIYAMVLEDFAIPQLFAIFNIIGTPAPDWATFSYLFGSEVFVLVLPTILSTIFAFRAEKERAVPPFYMSLVALGLFIFVVYPPNSGINILSLYVLGISLFLNAVVQDHNAVAIVGRYSPRNQFLTCCMTVHRPTDEIRELLRTPRIRDALGLRPRVWPTERGSLLRTRGTATSQLAIELVPVSSTDTLMRVVHFGKTRYEILTDDGIRETQRVDVAYIKDVFLRYGIRWDYAADELAEPLVNSLLDEFRGLMERVREVSTMKLLSAFASIVAIAVGVALLLTKHADFALGTFGIAAYLIYETVTLFRET